jgi:imidazolonepropionase-like amidohydrolase
MIDLRGGYVTPAFGDAHTHNLDGSFRLDSVRAAYVREGTLYVQTLTNSRTGADEVRGRFNRPCELDVAYANGGISSTLSHPFLAYEPRAMGIYSDWEGRAAEIRRSRRAERNSYWFVDDTAALAVEWPKILAGRPDIVKVFLLDATENPPPVNETGLPSGRGLRPSVVAAVVRRAHAAGIRVAAHVETAEDFRIAEAAGVDLFAHLPGYEIEKNTPSRVAEIDSATARRAGERAVVFTPTVSLAVVSAETPTPDSLVNRRRDLQRRNIQLLLRHGAQLAIGSDWFGQTASREIEALQALGIMPLEQIVRAWMTTPRLMFPRRRIGVLDDGYEATFLVFRTNPFTSLDALRGITLRMKQGCPVS